ncbi:unnamed protein product [Rotaria sp. Silwood2]|nr:unnamed protein product [Rotaria sp. Silwood2]CAF2745429.1 unnamed protein product [Rotaria sp. Silwood2]CAF2931125.1 unnamed protein product [Rotaria sp. Silwood2]CAF3134875.1 unnamed protein product [Rotaria sp. Silwood2]CAF3898987.1 unnamed protein product [Rotaria sp. Silwood2]
MSYEESSSFYQSTSGGSELVGGENSVAFDGNMGGIAYGGSLQGVAFGGGLEDAAQGSYSNYESTSATGYGAGAAEAVLVGGGGASNEYYSSSSNAQLGAGAQASSSDLETGFEQQNLSGAFLASNAGYSASSLEQQSFSSTAYATDDQGLYKDPNPEVIRRPAPGGPQTYTQRVLVRFLQPPAVPPPGPLIIKEVRPPQPPPPPPLYIRQRPPPPPTLPPIVIREAPPKMPPPVGTQVITKMLPAIPVPPRSVIIERLPPMPPKPRDVIVERWLPYRTQQKRRVIIQRAPPPVIPKPRNIIIYYEAPKAQVVRRFHNLGVQRANPVEYVARYGTQLEDAQTLVTQARQAGVVEDISPPAGTVSNLQSASYESYQSGGIGAGVGAANYEVVSSAADGYGVSGGFSSTGDAGLRWIGGAGLNVAGDAGLNLVGGAGGVSSSNYDSSSSYNASSGTGGYVGGLESSFGGLGLVDNSNNVGGGSNSYESYSSQQTFTQ